LLCGLFLPFAVTCVVLAVAGVFGPFWFWTITYAREYATAVSAAQLHGVLAGALSASVGPDLVFWIIAGFGAVIFWWERRLRARLLFMAGFLVAGVMALCAGMYFRHHYFILLLPVVALLNGVVVSWAVHIIRRKKRSAELLLAFCGLFLFGLSVFVGFAVNGEDWFSAKSEAVSKHVYGTSVFCETRSIARQLESISSADDRLVVLGSEPEIYFYSRRRSGSGYIYMYPLMESHPYASKMQDEMIHEIENSQPRFVIYSTDLLSWFHIKRGQSSSRILSWWEEYWSKHYDLLMTINITSLGEPASGSVAMDSTSSSAGCLLLLQRKPEKMVKSPN
jgi:hypothetical protein